MWQLAIRQIHHEPLRSALIVLAISAAVAMILILRGFEQGLYVQSERVVLDRGGQLIATQQGVRNFLAARSSLPQLSRAEVEAVDGVISASPITGFWIIHGPQGNKYPVLVLVYDTLGGPTHLLEGNQLTEATDVVIDIGLSKRAGLERGDPFVISDFEFRVAGITSGSSALFSSFAFISYDGMIDLFLESEIATDITTFPLLSFLLINVAPQFDPMEVAAAIERQVADVDVFTPQQLADNDVELGRQLFGPIMRVLILLSYCIGLLVIGLIIYSDVATRRRQFGIMKALGFRLSQIINSAVLQTLLLVLLAFPAGVLLAYACSEALEWSMPVYQVPVLDSSGLLQALLGVLLITLVACLLPIRMIARTDPVIIFQDE